MVAAKTRSIVLVLGMHRSGTSALTRALNLMGADIPGTLMPALPDVNPLGFWESLEVMGSHERFLAATGSYWNDIRPPPDSVFAGAAAKTCGEELADLLKRAWETSPLLVVKDPRLCVLMPIWRFMLKKLKAECQVVLLLRHPLEVAASLQIRNGMVRDRALQLWLLHTLLAERESRSFRRHLVTYEHSLSNPEAAAELAGRIGWFAPDRVRAAQPAVAEHWRHDLRHHVERDDAFLTDSGNPAWSREAYGWLLKAAAGQNAVPPLDALFREVMRAAESLGACLDLAGRAEQLAAAQAERDEQARLRTLIAVELSAAESRIAERDELLRGKEAGLAAGAARLAEEERLRAAAEKAVRDRDIQLTERDAVIRQREEAIAESAALLAEERRRLAASEKRGRDREAEIAGLAEMIRGKEAALDEQTALLRRKEDEIVSLSERLAEERTARAQSENAATGALKRLQKLVSQRESEIADLGTALAGLRNERDRDAQGLERLRTMMREVEASLDRQRDHLAVLSFRGARHG